MAQYHDPDVFVSLDESAADAKTGQRLHGWSPKGQPGVHRMSFLCGLRYSDHMRTDQVICFGDP